MRLIKFSRKQLLVLFLIVVATALIGLETQRTAQRLSATRAKLASLSKDEVLLGELTRFHQEFSLDVGKVEAALPLTHQEIGQYAAQIEEAAASAGGQVFLTIAPQPEGMVVETQAVKSLRMTAEFSGSYQSLIQFLNIVANLPYFAQVNTLEVAGNQVGGISADVGLLLFLGEEKI